MISINLLPFELRPVKRTPLPYLFAIVIAGLAGLFCFKLFISDQLKKSDMRQQLTSNKADLKSHEENIKEYNALVEKKQLLATKLKTINEIASDRIIWSFHLSTLANLAPDNLWYERIEESQRTITEYYDVTDPKTGKVSKKPRKRIIPVLKITGSVSADDDGLQSINPFLTLLSNDKDFSSMFEIEPPKLGYKSIGDDVVRTFEIQCIIAPQIGDSK